MLFDISTLLGKNLSIKNKNKHIIKVWKSKISITTNWKKMSKIKIITILFSLCFVFAQISYPVSADDQQVDIDYNQAVSLNVKNCLEIVDIEVSDIVIKCFSKITVNVTVKNRGIPSFITVLVYLKTESNELKNNFFLIGSKRLFIKCCAETKISITCRTWSHRFIYFDPKYSDYRDEVFYEGFIGARVVKLPILRAIPARRPIVNSCQRLNDILGEKILTYYPKIPNMINSLIQKFNDFDIEWKPVTLVDPFITKKIIDFEWWKIPEQTNEEGSFSIELNVSNSLSIDLPLKVVIFIRQDIVAGAIFRNWGPLVGYPAGIEECTIPKNSNINLTINCTFPEENFQEGYYDIRITLYSWIPADGNKNWLGWMKGSLEIRKMPRPFANKYAQEYWDVIWTYYKYAPIVNSEAYIGAYTWGTNIYTPTKKEKIYLNIKTPQEKQIEGLINETIEQVEELKNQTFEDAENLSDYLEEHGKRIINTTMKNAKDFSNYFFLQLLAVLLTVVGFGLITYWVIRKKT